MSVSDDNTTLKMFQTHNTVVSYMIYVAFKSNSDESS
jgi:hypothetical protein